MARVDGVDLSHWQSGALDFNAAKRAGVKFVYHKATEGPTYVDPNHSKRRVQVHRADLRFGSYHFARPSQSSPVQQARHFLSIARPVKGDMRCMLDLEDRGGLGQLALTQWVLAFDQVIFKATGEHVILYTPFDLNKSVSNLPLWVARYNDAMEPPHIPTPYSKYTIWQFSNGQYGVPDSVAGIGHADLNVLQDGVQAIELTIGYAGNRAARRARRQALRAKVRHAVANREEVQARIAKAEARLRKIVARIRALRGRLK